MNLRRQSRQIVPALLVVLLAWLASGGAAAQQGRPIELVPNVDLSDQVISVAFSPDGHQVLSGSADRKWR